MPVIKKSKKDINKSELITNKVDKFKKDSTNLTNVESKQESESVVESTIQPAVAKAGKRSNKSQIAIQEKKAKEERKVQSIEDKTTEKPKFKPNPTRTKLERQGKKFREMAKKIDKNKLYTLLEALDLATQTSPVKFDATVELHVNLNVDPKQADQNIRDNVLLPAGTGKTIRVAVFSDEKIDNCDVSGIDNILKSLEKGIINYDVLIATPTTMPKLSKYARLLGPRGLMPNPKSGTVTADINKAVAEAKAGRIEYRVDSTGIIHLGIGKVSFGKDKLLQNFQSVITSIKLNKPASVKDSYIKSIHIATSMGPSITISVSDI